MPALSSLPLPNSFETIKTGFLILISRSLGFVTPLNFDEVRGKSLGSTSNLTSGAENVITPNFGSLTPLPSFNWRVMNSPAIELC
mgnify:CR=1 FL=1